MPVQRRNADLIELLSADLQARAEPNFAWKSAAAVLQVLPVLRGAWPMSSVGYLAADQARDISGQGNHLTNNNTAIFAHAALVPAVGLTGASNHYLSRVDGGLGNWADIIGTEAYVTSAQRGLTLGGWFYFNGAAAAIEVMMSKAAGAGTRSYQLHRRATGEIRFQVSTDGTNWVTVDSTER